MAHARLVANRRIVVAQAVLTWNSATAEEIQEFVQCGVLPGEDHVEPYNEDAVKALVGRAA